MPPASRSASRISLNAPIETLSLENWRRQFDVNLFGHVAMTRALLPALPAAQGRVVNVSSIGGLVALPTYGAYAASKFAVVVRALAQETGARAVTVNAVIPTATDGAGYFTGAGPDDPIRVLTGHWSPTGSRMGSVSDVADVVEFFAGNLSRWVSGQQLLVSGGAPS